MTYTHFDYQRPAPQSDNGTAAFTATRQNLLAVRDGVMLGVMPGWAMTPAGGTAAEPETLTYSRGDERLEMNITWGASGGTAGNPTSIAYRYSADAGATWASLGTETITYDSAGNVTGTTWS